MTASFTPTKTTFAWPLVWPAPSMSSRLLTRPRSVHRHILTILILITTSACGRTPEPLTFNFHLLATPTTLDPHRSTDRFSQGVADRLFDGLIRLDRVTNLPVPDLTESYSVSPDGLVYEFLLQPEARFHNGRFLLASDVRYSWQRLLAPATASKYAWLLYCIEGAEAYHAGEAPDVTGIEIEDPHLVRVRLRKRFESFLYHLSDLPAAVVPREEIERLGERFGRQPVGSGSFQFSQWVGDARIELRAFQQHARFRPQVDTLVYHVIPDGDEILRRYRAGELDLVSQIPSASLLDLQHELSADLRILPGLSWIGFCLRCDRRPFDDSRVRRALALALDRDQLVAMLGASDHIAAVGFVPQSVPGHDPLTFTSGYDLERARRLLVEAGFPGGKGIAPMVYATRVGETEQQVLAFLGAAFSQLGITIEPQVMDFASLLSSASDGRFPLFYRGWTGDYPDPYNYLYPFFHSGSPLNTLAYNYPQFDQLLDSAREEPIPERRLSLLNEAEAFIIEEAPCVVLYHRSDTILLRPRWKGIPLGFVPELLEIERAELVR